MRESSYRYGRQPSRTRAINSINLVLTALVALGSGLPAVAEVNCAGGDTMQAVATHWADAFHAGHADSDIRVQTSGKLSADGFADFLDGRINCVLMVRELFPAETQEFERRFGRNVGLLRVATGSFATRGATHAIAIYTNNANPLQRVSMAQLEALFGAAPRSGKSHLVQWGELGVRGPLSDQPIHVYGMIPRRANGNPPGIVNYLQQTLLGGGQWRQDLRIQTDTANSSALQAIVERVAQDPAGIGYSGFGFAQPGVHTLAIGRSARGAFVEGTPASVASRSYPLSRSIYIAFDPGAMTAPLCQFLRYTLTEDAQRALSDDPQQFLPLPARDLESSRKGLRSITHGHCRH
jgi:phosphate transport system substrate-binding protein